MNILQGQIAKWKTTKNQSYPGKSLLVGYPIPSGQLYKYIQAVLNVLDRLYLYTSYVYVCYCCAYPWPKRVIEDSLALTDSEGESKSVVLGSVAGGKQAWYWW